MLCLAWSATACEKLNDKPVCWHAAIPNNLKAEAGPACRQQAAWTVCCYHDLLHFTVPTRIQFKSFAAAVGLEFNAICNQQKKTGNRLHNIPLMRRQRSCLTDQPQGVSST